MKIETNLPSYDEATTGIKEEEWTEAISKIYTVFFRIHTSHRYIQGVSEYIHLIDIYRVF